MTSTIKVNNIQNQCGANIINENSNTITIGASGDTIALASGASQTGFGRTGTVDWQTGSIKSSASFTAVSGEGYFVDTSSNTVTANLPAGSAGAIVSFADYTNTFQNNALTVSPNGSQKIGGVAAPTTLSTEGQSITLVYVDDTEGWKNVQDSTSNVVGNPFIIATGGTESTVSNCKIHIFTGPGTFTVSAVGASTPVNQFSHMVLGGGGGAGGQGGGGAGGYREVKTPETPYTASPLDGFPSAPNIVTASVGSFPIVVGGGGAAGGGCSGVGTNGSASSFSTISSAGGGAGNNSGGAGVDGGSGGGAGFGGPSQAGGTGNTPPVTPAQGQNGGKGNSAGYSDARGGGGGGAGAVGVDTPGTAGGAGGAGVTSNITNTPTQRAGGGGGGGDARPGPIAPGGRPGGAGGAGGGGAGAGGGSNPGGTAGTANTGGGGGAAGYGPGYNSGAAGGSGIVVIRYKYQ